MTNATRLKKNGMPRAPRTKAERLASMKAFALTMSEEPTSAPPTVNPAVFSVEGESARRIAIVMSL